jgi:hypothetical protein
MSAAICEPGWGEGLSFLTVPRLRDHPTPPRRFASTLPLQGRVSRYCIAIWLSFTADKTILTYIIDELYI